MAWAEENVLEKVNVDTGTVYKSGMNASDIAQMAKAIAAGITLERVSMALKVELKTVRSFATSDKVKKLVRAHKITLKKNEATQVNVKDLYGRIKDLENANQELFTQSEKFETALLAANGETEKANDRVEELLEAAEEVKTTIQKLEADGAQAVADGAQAVADLEKLEADMSAVKTVKDLEDLVKTRAEAAAAEAAKGEDK